jgi:ABC-type branched-subunit amino acid transport system permease subunit
VRSSAVSGSCPTFAQEMVWARYPYVHPLLFGAIIVAVVLAMPRGVLGLLQLKFRLPRTI